MKTYFRILTFLLLGSQTIFAQTDSSKKQPLKFKLGINYNSGLNYYGRTDSLKSTGVFPMAELWFSKNMYISAAPVFVNNAIQSLDYAGTVTSLGYLHASEKWITNLYVTKPFYEKSSQLVQSALKAQAGASFTHLNKIVNLTGGGDVKWSDKLDIGTTVSVDHLIRKQLRNKNVLVIDPAFSVYAGTQNFSNTYNRKRSGFLVLPGSSEQVTETVKQFNILAYEVSLPLIYAKGKLMVLLTPSYIMPQNLITVPGRADLSEQGGNRLYATAGIKYSF